MIYRFARWLLRHELAATVATTKQARLELEKAVLELENAKLILDASRTEAAERLRERDAANDAVDRLMRELASLKRWRLQRRQMERSWITRTIAPRITSN
jgi:hypothetical protein